MNDIKRNEMQRFRERERENVKIEKKINDIERNEMQRFKKKENVKIEKK